MQDARKNPEKYVRLDMSRAFNPEQRRIIREAEEGVDHEGAEVYYARLLFQMLDISVWKHPIKKWRALKLAETFRDGHRKCCEWAREED